VNLVNILFVNDYVEKIGGCEIYLHNIKNILENKGHNVHFLGKKKNQNLFKQYLGSFYDFKFKKSVRELIKINVIDIVYARSICRNVSPSFLSVCEKENIPVVINIPNIYEYRYPCLNSVIKRPYRVLTLAKKWLLRRAVKKHVDLFIAPSNNTKKFLKDEVNVNNIKIVNHPIFWGVSSDVLIQIKSSFKLLYVGRLSPRKGLMTLLKSIKMLSKKATDFQLDIIGEGLLMDKIYSFIKTNDLENVVEIRGWVQHSNLKKEYKEANVTVFPATIEENFGHVIIESFSQGTPVITTNIGGQKDLVTDEYDGLLVSPNDHYELASKIKRLMDDTELLKRLSKNSLESAKEYSIDKHVESLTNIFSELIEEKNDKRS